MDFQERGVFQEHQDQMVDRVNKAREDQLEVLVKLDHKDQRDHKEVQENVGHKAKGVNLGLQEALEPLEDKEKGVPVAQMANQDNEDHLVNQANKASLVAQENKDNREKEEKEVNILQYLHVHV